MNERIETMFELPDVTVSRNSSKTELRRNLHPELDTDSVSHTVNKTNNGYGISIKSDDLPVINLTLYLLAVQKYQMGHINNITVSQEQVGEPIHTFITTTKEAPETNVSDDFARAAAEYQSSVQFEEQDTPPTQLTFTEELFAAASTGTFRPCGLYILPAQSETSLASTVCIFENMNVDSVNWV